MIKDADTKKGSILVIVILIIAALSTLGIISLYSSGRKVEQVSEEKLEREALHLANAGLNQGAANLKLDDSDGFNDSELTTDNATETVTINSVAYTLRKWVNTTTVTSGRKYKVWITDNDDDNYVAGAPSNDCIISATPNPTGDDDDDGDNDDGDNDDGDNDDGDDDDAGILIGPIWFAKSHLIDKAWAADDDDGDNDDGDNDDGDNDDGDNDDGDDDDGDNDDDAEIETSCSDGGDAETDYDNAVVLIAKGWVEDDTGEIHAYAFVKGLYKRVALNSEYALLTEGDITMNGSISVTGSTPSIHTNSNLTSIGNADEAEGAVTASGTMSGSVNLTGGGTTGTGGAALVDIPSFNAAYYRTKAAAFVWDTATDPILDGTCERAPAAGTDCVKICNTGGTYTVTSPKPNPGAVCRKVGGATNASGVFYFDGPVNVETSGEWAAAILAAGDITLKAGSEITGSLDLDGVGLVSDGDISYSGNVTVGSADDQLGMYAGGKFDLSGGGNKTLYGPLIALDASSTTSLSGNITIVYDNSSPPSNGPLIGKLISWTQLE